MTADEMTKIADELEPSADPSSNDLVVTGPDPKDRTQAIHDGMATQIYDSDPDETQEWLDSLDAVVDNAGPLRARHLLSRVIERARSRAVGLPALRSTDYINTIPPEEEPEFPGDESLERRYRRYIRWNAAVMVHRAQRPGIGVGGHISTYASSAALYEVGFNHFFRGRGHPGGGDQIYIQGHGSPGVYARAYLEGRLDEDLLDGFRQELSRGPGNGLPSYPHPRLMPDFWEYPTVSMGLGPLNAIYQARFNRYLHNRGIKDTSDQRVWAFLGDGEMDEVESLGAIGLAAREELDNLTFVINANLQRLDGPVRGNGKIIQELESFFTGAGWNVIKVVWGRGWDDLLARDTEGALLDIMNTTPDGDFQTYKANNGAFVREHFFGRDPRALKMVEHMSDDEIWKLQRGGHDYRKVYAAYKRAVEHTGQPTVIIAKTIKGWTLGPHFEGRNATHQMKKLALQDLQTFRDRMEIPISDKDLDEKLPPYYKPAQDSDELEYMRERRRELGGDAPSRPTEYPVLGQPAEERFEVMKRGSGKQPVATTMAFVRLVRELFKDEAIGKRIVPIIPDEARTFGMDSFFPNQKIYSPHGQHYTSVDSELILAYKESTDGVILHEGINEAGSTASFTAVGTSYATHGEPMIPMYIFYSMFGFQRTGDGFWAAGDQMARGFVLGATAGRTTLNGEGLQHQDGHSLLLASTNPAVVAYDAAYGYELGHITKDAIVRMYGDGSDGRDQNVMYYLTMYNEPYPQPAEPEGVDVEGILRGIHLVSPGQPDSGRPRVQLLASGVAVPWAIEAQRMLGEDWGVDADVWSVTSWNELRRDALDADKHNFMNPGEQAKVPYVTSVLADRQGPVVAVSDYMRAVQDQIRQWVPGRFNSLGTDGFGLSDTRPALRRHFAVDAPTIVLRALTSLSEEGQFDAAKLPEVIERYHVFDPTEVEADLSGGQAT
ncbi:pyruvate dehydrogenase (acetyl-transferring), homodimeric type [Epidermidibacterium keratini]